MRDIHLINKLLLTGVTFSCLTVSGVVMAQDQNITRAGYTYKYRCTANSNGYYFHSELRDDRESAKSEATEECNQDRHTRPLDCLLNVDCERFTVDDGDTGRYLYQCKVSSNGQSFSDTSSSLETAKESVKTQCDESPGTNPIDCMLNIRCRRLN